MNTAIHFTERFCTVLLFIVVSFGVSAYNTCPVPESLGVCPGTLDIGSTIGANDNATSGAGSCAGFGVGTAGQNWYTFSTGGCGSSQVTVTTDFGVTNFDTKLHIYSGYCGNLVCAAADDDSGTGVTSLLTFSATAGIIYYIRVGGYQAQEGNYIISVACGAAGCNDAGACNYDPAAGHNNCTCIYPPANDICTYAVTLNPGYYSAGNNTCTVVDGPLPWCGGFTMLKDLWYKFEYHGGTIAIYGIPGTLTDTRMALYDGCGGNVLDCNNDFFTGQGSYISLGCNYNWVQGQTYYLQIGGNQNLSGAFSIYLDILDVTGCTNPLATNFNFCANVDDGTCQTCPSDLDGNGAVNIADLLLFTSEFGNVCD